MFAVKCERLSDGTLQHATGDGVYVVLYDVLRDGRYDWESFVIGPFLLLIGILTLYLRRNSVSRIQLQLGLVVLFVSALFVTPLSVLAFRNTFLELRRQRELVRSGSFDQVEGVVERYRPRSSEGFPGGSFCVGARCFSYSNGDMSPNLWLREQNTGAIANGAEVRVSYVGDRIVRLEVISKTTNKE
jgi:hypothetical protein